MGRALEIVERRLKAVGASGYLWLDDAGAKYEQHRLSTYVYDLQPYSAKSQRREGGGLELTVTGWTPHNLRRSSRTLLASGQITLRKVDGWKTLHEPPIALDLAA